MSHWSGKMCVHAWVLPKQGYVAQGSRHKGCQPVAGTRRHKGLNHNIMGTRIFANCHMFITFSYIPYNVPIAGLEGLVIYRYVLLTESRLYAF